MSFEAQIDRLIEKLTELTNGDKVIWQDTADENSFLTTVENSTVVVGRLRSDPAAACFIRILDGTGKTIKEAHAAPEKSDILSEYRARRNPDREVATQDFGRLLTLHELARRSALKSEKVVSDLLSTLEAIR